MTRIYEKDPDTLFIRLFRTNLDFLKAFLKSAIGNSYPSCNPLVLVQTGHKGNPGSIDIELHFGKELVLLIENKIDAGYSTTLSGDGQVERYRKSVKYLRDSGVPAKSVLLAPRLYRTRTRFANHFDAVVDYEDLKCALSGDDLKILESGINQTAATSLTSDGNSTSTNKTGLIVRLFLKAPIYFFPFLRFASSAYMSL